MQIIDEKCRYCVVLKNLCVEVGSTKYEDCTADVVKMVALKGTSTLGSHHNYEETM
jgi:hypothetical protein